MATRDSADDDPGEEVNKQQEGIGDEDDRELDDDDMNEEDDDLVAAKEFASLLTENKVAVIHKIGFKDCEIWFVRFSLDDFQKMLAFCNQVGRIYVLDLDVEQSGQINYSDFVKVCEPVNAVSGIDVTWHKKDQLPYIMAIMKEIHHIDEEMDLLPVDLQYLDKDKKIEKDLDMKIILWEKDRGCLLAVENLVDILIKREDEIKIDNFMKDDNETLWNQINQHPSLVKMIDHSSTKADDDNAKDEEDDTEDDNDNAEDEDEDDDTKDNDSEVMTRKTMIQLLSRTMMMLQWI